MGKEDKSYSEMYPIVYSRYARTIILISSVIVVPCMGTLKEQARRDSSIDEKWHEGDLAVEVFLRRENQFFCFFFKGSAPWYVIHTPVDRLILMYT